MDKNKAVWDWIQKYDGVSRLYFNFGEAQDGSSEIIPIPSDTVVKTDICGNKTCHYDFAVTVFKDFETLPFASDNVTDYAAVREFMEWIDVQEDIRNYPVFDGCIIKEIKNLQNNPTPSEQDAGLAKYMFKVRIIYIKTEV